MAVQLEGKHILLVAPRFFGYEKEIENELVKRGAMVDYLTDNPFDNTFIKAIARHNRRLLTGAVRRYYYDALDRLSRPHYDMILVVCGHNLPTAVLTEWRSIYPKAKFVFYTWDSIVNNPFILRNVELFDYCFSFDKADSFKYGFHFRPLFFSDGYDSTEKDALSYDMSFIGTMHSDRYALISSIAKSLPQDVHFYNYLYIQARWVYYLYKCSNPSFRASKVNEFQFDKLKQLDVQHIFSISKTILDIEHPAQTGLTIRTLETFGAKKKLVTTNKDICNYDFYSASNIYIIDRKKPKLDLDFLKHPYNDINPNLYRKYSISGWLNEILYTAYC